MKLVKVRINDSNVPFDFTREGIACYTGNDQYFLSDSTGRIWPVNGNQLTIIGDTGPEGTSSEGSSLRELLGQNVRTLHVEFS